MNIIILGAGTFGTAIGNALAVNVNNNVVIFSTNKQKVDEINTDNTNRSCFPNKQLTKTLTATANKKDIKNADIVFVALPSTVVIEYLLSIQSFLKKDVLLVNLSKGIFSGGETIVESIKNSLNVDNVVTLKGPSFAVELLEHADTLLTLGYAKESQRNMISQIIKDTSMHIDFTTDIRGVELLSVIKNIYAIFLGIVDAKYNSSNTRFMILTKSFLEIRIILLSLKGREETLFSACGFGDLCLTSLNDLSRNRTLGLLIGKGFFNTEYKSNTVILEGLNSIRVLAKMLPEEHVVSLPIFYKLHMFFTEEKKEFELNFDDLIK